MLSTVNEVLYVGNNVDLIKASLAINNHLNHFNVTHFDCIDDIEKLIETIDYTHFICELPVLNSVKKDIAKKFPKLNCTYLNNVESDSLVVETKEKSIDQFISPQMKMALNAINLPLYYKNEQDHVIAYNHCFAQLFGLHYEALNTSAVSTIFPDSITKKIKQSKLLLEKDLSFSFECQLDDAVGHQHDFLLTESVVEKSPFVIGCLLDITETNRLKTALEKEGLMLRASANLSSDLIFFKDLESRFTACNKQFEKFVGCSEAEIFGKKDDQLFEINQAKMCQAQDLKVIENDEIYVNNEFLTYHNGEKHFIFMQKVPLKDKSGKVQGLLAIGRDITETSINERRLKLTNVVFENSRDGILVTDGEGTVITANDACFSISGYAKTELLNEKINTFAAGREYRHLFINIERSLKQSGKWQGNVNFRTKRGEFGYYWLEVYEVKHNESRVNNRIYIFTDLTQNKHNEQKIQYLSKHDSLTGLNNRIALFNHLEAAITRANRTQNAVGVLFIEVKGVKSINDRFGHHQGDLVIIEVSKILQQLVFEKDFVARFGDEQFIIVIEEIEHEQVLALVAQRVAQSFSGSLNVGNMFVNLSISIGISVSPDDGIDTDSILSNAEMAMLRSKSDKSSLYHFYTNELTVNSSQQLELENELKIAIDQGQFKVYFQPQFDFNKKQVVAMESVLRWHHPQHGTLLPERFLMLAEQSHLITTLGMKVFEQSALQAVKWHNDDINFGRISISLSKQELLQSSLIGFIQKVLLDTGCKIECFEFAIDESLFSCDLYIVQENIFNLSRLGASLTVDGFGAERSVLYSIDKLNIDKFKISKQFIQGIPGYLAGEAMLKSMFVLANSLGIDVVGESVDGDPFDYTDRNAPLSINKGNSVKGAMTAAQATFYLRCHKRK